MTDIIKMTQNKNGLTFEAWLAQAGYVGQFLIVQLATKNSKLRKAWKNGESSEVYHK